MFHFLIQKKKYCNSFRDLQKYLFKKLRIFIKYFLLKDSVLKTVMSFLNKYICRFRFLDLY